jgi:hypothetical protein
MHAMQELCPVSHHHILAAWNMQGFTGTAEARSRPLALSHEHTLDVHLMYHLRIYAEAYTSTRAGYGTGSTRDLCVQLQRHDK